MNVRKQLLKRTIAGDVILLPVGDASLELKGLLTLNETGERMWDLLLQCEGSVKARVVQNVADLPERKLQLPEEQNGMKPPEGCIVIQPVAGLRHLCGLQQADGVIVVERAHAHAAEAADFPDRSHGHPSRLKPSINHDVT